MNLSTQASTQSHCDYGSFIHSAPANDDHLYPMRKGVAHAQWDSEGNTVVVTDRDAAGGGPIAAEWMQALLTALQTQLDTTRDAEGNSYALIPNLLPAIGFQYAPDGYNLVNGAKGFMELRWADEAGQLQIAWYDGQGTRINIDVLNAEQQLYTAQRDWQKARADTLMQGLRLKASNATLAESDLEAINHLLEN